MEDGGRGLQKMEAGKVPVANWGLGSGIWGRGSGFLPASRCSDSQQDWFDPHRFALAALATATGTLLHLKEGAIFYHSIA